MAFLGVETSLTGRKWLGPTVELERAAELIVQDTDLPRALAQVLARRGVGAQEAASFLAPQLRDLMPDPRSLKDMERASARIVRALDGRERVAIFADYDVDGGTSAALLIDWFRALGHDATLYVPDRIDEGYGPNAPAMEMLAADHSLIICVDCGTLSHEALAAATGTDIIVLDHHLGGETLPPALAVVNPNRQDETGDLAHLCAAAVVFLTLVDAGRILRERGDKGPDLISMLDLVALATVADVAPLIGVNRAFVVQGLKIMARRARIGLVALSDVGRLDTAPKAYHLGFVLGPRINAGGRIGQADLGARLLSCRDPHEASALAEKLDMLNSERRAIEEEVRAAALAQAEERGFDAPLVWAAGEGWHAGVVGIVASRLKEATGRPAVVIGFDGDEGKGSGRSVSGIDLGASIQRLAMDGMIEKGGGHKMAAGLSLSREQLEPAMARLSELLDKQGAGALGPSDLKLDGALMPGAANQHLVEQLDDAGPYGASAAGPRFAFPDCVIHFAKQIGTGHLKITFSDGTGPRLEAIAFGAFDTALGPTLQNHGGARFHLAGRLELNTWQGRTSVQLRLDDAAPAH
ncbi:MULTISPECIES: single-stranded-DNA-specific exonuclease RecJ [Lentibacter]|jgi:single-stranded-DNA-specific exonuclease|uniref:Single-stranded-DNA-specific exonuclease RecJ n=2 Tax=Lentibacter algarum TaxID=576131 RepID=A0A1H3JSQ4_9RHOB|nr:single-stranded-DNA-specific exonuclease RecJ [Lentibacter algarum]MCO4777754.1 single-stranded-DNA-specific exonuclease RecJ [Lentibacter algarum]WIF32332.1 single-stranded-DNA-specific exonuclease RecJ [Lentibacter algarum]SDY42921.1 exonuclease RecJ [Lentibacter algarum]